MKKALFFLIVIVSIARLSFAQNQGQVKIDSLFTVLKTAKEDTNTINKLVTLSSYYINNDPDKCIYYATMALDLSKKLNHSKGIGASEINIGTGKLYLRKYNEALDHYNNALAIFTKTGEKGKIAMIFSNIGVIYEEQSKYSKALENYFVAMDIDKEIGGKKDLSIDYNNIGNVLQEQGNYPKALQNYVTALKFADEVNDKEEIARVLDNIGIVYKLQGKYFEAIKNLLASLKIEEELGNEEGIAKICNNLGDAWARLRKFSDAQDYLNRGLQISKKIHSVDDMKESYYGLAYLDSARGNYQQAYEHFKLYITYRDSLFNEGNIKKTMQIQMTYDYDKKRLTDSLANEKEQIQRNLSYKDALHTKNNERNIFIFIGMVILVLAGGLWSRLRYIRRSTAILQKEKERSENLLLNILPAEIARELKEKGKADAKDFEEVSVLFTDFEDFSGTSEKLSSQELVAEIHACFKAFDGIIGKYGLEKIKTIGDSYMAAGGLPIHFPESVKNTVKAGLEMQEFVIRHKQERETQGYPAFEMRLGIHTGPVIAGIVGVKKFQYDIWGNTVNIADRMENKGEIRKVNISQSTFEFIKDDPGFCFEYRGKIEAKHKGELDMYFVATPNH